MPQIDGTEDPVASEQIEFHESERRWLLAEVRQEMQAIASQQSFILENVASSPRWYSFTGPVTNTEVSTNQVPRNIQGIYPNIGIDAGFANGTGRKRGKKVKYQVSTDSYITYEGEPVTVFPETMNAMGLGLGQNVDTNTLWQALAYNAAAMKIAMEVTKQEIAPTVRAEFDKLMSQLDPVVEKYVPSDPVHDGEDMIVETEKNDKR